MSLHHRTNNPYKPAAAVGDQHHLQQHQQQLHEAEQQQQNQQQHFVPNNTTNDNDNNNGGGAPQLPNLLDVPAEYHELTLHKPLVGKVSFVPYPKTQVAFANTNLNVSAESVDEPLQRIFIGQLPYGITEMQLQWMTQLLGGGVSLFDPEVIIKNQKKTGCVHARVRDSQLKQLVAGMHKRILVDDSGIWVGRTPSEIQILTQYVAELKADPKKRYPDRPYDTVVVQNATSERQQFHQGLPTLEDFFAQQQQQFAAQNGVYGGVGGVSPANGGGIGEFQ